MYNCTELIQLDSNDLKFWKFRKKNLNSFLSSFICRCVVFCSVPLLCPSAAQHSAFPPHLPCISLVSPAPVLFSAFFSARHCHLCLSAALSHLHLVPSLAHIFFYVLVASSALFVWSRSRRFILDGCSAADLLARRFLPSSAIFCSRRDVYVQLNNSKMCCVT